MVTQPLQTAELVLGCRSFRNKHCGCVHPEQAEKGQSKRGQSLGKEAQFRGRNPGHRVTEEAPDSVSLHCRKLGGTFKEMSWD